MSKVTLPQAQAIAARQYEIKRKRLGTHMAQRSEWITTRANAIFQNGANQQEMRLLEEVKGRAA